MVDVEVEGAETEPFVPNLRSFRDLSAHRSEEVLDLPDEHADQVANTSDGAGTESGDVGGFLCQDPGFVLGLKDLSVLNQGLREVNASIVEILVRRSPVCGG